MDGCGAGHACQVVSAFALDPGSDGLLVLNGVTYLKDGR